MLLWVGAGGVGRECVIWAGWVLGCKLGEVGRTGLQLSAKRSFIGRYRIPRNHADFGGDFVRKGVRKSMFGKGAFYEEYRFLKYVSCKNLLYHRYNFCKRIYFLTALSARIGKNRYPRC